MIVPPGRAFPIAPGADLSGIRATVMGLGHFSGGVETVRFLAARGADVTVTDAKDEAALAPSVAAIADLPVTLRLGGHAAPDFASADLVVASPAVPPESPWLKIAADAGAAVVTELSLTMRLLRGRTVWITGTCGKSTTTALLGEMLGRGGLRARVGGNIGRALLGVAEEAGPGDVTVIEVSSFQLEWLARDGIVPDLAVVTNVTPNHLDRHRTLEAYADAKAAAVLGPGPAILNADDPVSVDRIAPRARGPVHWFSAERPVARGAFAAAGAVRRRDGEDEEEELLRFADLRLLGDFNRANAGMAALAARLLGTPASAIAAAAREFRGLPHRLEDLGRFSGVRGVNDSKATTPEAAIRALRALDAPVVLVAGGFERGAELGEFAAVIRERVRVLVLLGESADRLAAAVGEGGPEVLRAGSVEEAVDRGLARAAGGDVLLLSPGHASWDMYRDYEERGERFAARFRAASAGA